MPSIAGCFEPLRSALEEAGDPRQALDMGAYMKDHFVFFGVKTPERRRLQRSTLDASATASSADLIEFADRCWQAPDRELQYVAVDVLRKRAASLEPGSLPDLRRLIEHKSWWDTVDALAAHVVGPLVRANPALVADMDRWIVDENLWIARTAMLHQLMWKDDTDPDRLFEYASLQAGHQDFFMRKAIGWALRQYARVDPEAVWAFVDSHAEELSGLTRREALKHR